jgi:importin subunit alpha-2
VTNFTSGGNVQQLAAIVQMGVLKPFCDLLGSKDWRTVVVVMDGLSNIMQVTDVCCTRIWLITP